ncbi:MAG: polysaccharide pyruvyl transferase family protein [Cyanobacterium sp.]
MKKTLICGFYGNDNLGDEAMFSGMMTLLSRKNQDLSFSVLSDNPSQTRKRFQVQSLERNNKKPQFQLQRWLAFLENRYFILGGGDLLRDTAKYSIAKEWLGHLQKAIALRHRTLVLGISVGEINRPETKRLIPKVLNQVDFIGVRDQQSQQKLIELGVNNTIHVTSDLALEALTNINLAQKSFNNKSINIGISVRFLQGRGSSLDISGYSNLQKEIAAIADCLYEKYQAQIHFLPLRTHKNIYHSQDDDYVSILEILRYSRYSNNFIIHRYFASLDDFYQVISQLDLIIGMRLHSLIISAGLGIPIIAAQYDPKVEGFMEEIAQGDRSIPLHQFELKLVLEKVESILNNPQKARQEIELAVKKYRQKMLTIEPEIHKIFSL